ncbi:hypothetical protein Ddye_004826 [Dipteronia dyeriana]|uniref:Uncharacterized protein n=1 Tax=Dipteronia dyeriana TaxID=168575 RepID=A0AAD9XF78_9ROSI|nr:hypothetical protein Ddye_004826 [Dipteronia dyeriana]
MTGTANYLIHTTSNANLWITATADPVVVPEGYPKRKEVFLATKGIENTSTTRRRLEHPGTNQTSVLLADNKRTKSAKLIQQLRQIADEVPFDVDIESIFSEQDDVNLHTTFMIQDTKDSGLSSESSYFLESDLPSEAYQVTNGSNLSIGPQIQVQILVEKYSKPISTITYFDTGTHSTMMNPRVLPPAAWKKKDNEFLAADGQIFTTNLVSKHKIGIQFFPLCTLWTHVIDTPLPDKDILIGWDAVRKRSFVGKAR